MFVRRLATALLAASSLALPACASPTSDADDAEEAGDSEDAVVAELAGCASSPACRRTVKELTKILVVSSAEEAYFRSAACPKPDAFSHFVDFADVKGGRPLFTSVQDFTIHGDVDPKEVTEAFRSNWLAWWKGGTVREGSVRRYDNGDFGIEIRPLGFSFVSIDMRVPPPRANPEHPRLARPDRDPRRGETLHWDQGVTITMSEPPSGEGKAFKGTMYVLARKIETGVHVREIWYDTEPVAPLVMKLLPLGSVQNRLRVAAFLHIISLQGCALPRGTGYPGLIAKLENEKK